MSPGYGISNYPHLLSCTWTVDVKDPLTLKKRSVDVDEAGDVLKVFPYTSINILNKKQMYVPCKHHTYLPDNAQLMLQMVAGNQLRIGLKCFIRCAL